MTLEKYYIEIYQDKRGLVPFVKWIESLKDVRARAKIKVRLTRLRLGNLGDYKSVGDGVYELRIDEGIGYRVYFAQEPDMKIILLGGSKKTQPQDIGKAKQYIKDYRS
jgi:putative addiction module killer protein